MTGGRAAALLLAAALSLAAARAQGARDWQVDAATQRLEFRATQAGAGFTGRFTRFTPQIRFDPTDPARSRLYVEIDTASADTQDAERDRLLRGPDFFAAERFPKAVFETLRIRHGGDGSYAATGRLTLRDATRDVALRFTFHPARGGAPARLQGETLIRRLDFGVGQGEWRDTTWVGDEVQVRFDLALTPPAAAD